MIKSYIKILFNNFVNQKLYLLLNILGLSLGLATVLVITLYLQHQLSYDRHYENSGNIYLVGRDLGAAGIVGPGISSSMLGPLLKEEFSEIKAMSRYRYVNDTFSVSTDGFPREDFQLRYVDADFFRIFDFEWVAGSPESAFDRPESIVLTRRLANHFFGNTDVLGNTILLNESTNVVVVGVIEDLPETTHLQFTALIPMALYEQELLRTGREPGGWRFLRYNTYVLLDDLVDTTSLQEQFPDFVRRHISENYDGDLGLTLQSLPEIHLSGIAFVNSSSARSQSMISNAMLIQILAGVVLAILVIALVNYTNLATARSSTRAKEVGLKMSIGVGRYQLIRQFLTESLCLVAFALFLGLVWAELLLPFINEFLNINLTFSTINPLILFGLLLLIVTILGVAAGSYPAFYLTAYDSAKVLRGDLTRGESGRRFRDFLVVIQFAISIALVVVTIVMYRQMFFGQTFDRGFLVNDVVTINVSNNNFFDINNQWQALEGELLQVPGVLGVTYALSTPMSDRSGGGVYKEGEPDIYRVNTLAISANYLQSFGINLIAGNHYLQGGIEDGIAENSFSNMRADRNGVILNEVAARNLGWSPQEAVGQVLRFESQDDQPFRMVIGVVQNTVSSSKRDISPILYYQPDRFERATISMFLAGQTQDETLQQMRTILSEFTAEDEIRFMNLSRQVEFEYFQEQRQITIFTAASIITIIISCFGLFGLAAFNTERRRKEIGIRKVLGGSVWRIVLLLTNDFSKLVLISNVIAWPVAYIAMNRWLENFAYRIDLTPLIFVGSGLIALSIAWVTVGGTAAKAASAKPVQALRYE